MKIKKLLPMNAESSRMTDWMEEGVYDALQKKYLKTLVFCVCETVEGPMTEEYAFSFSYSNSESQEVSMNVNHIGNKKQGRTFKCNSSTEITPNQMRSSACKVVRTLIQLARTLDKMPEERTILMKFLYYDDVTPVDYEPPFFRGCTEEEVNNSWTKNPLEMVLALKVRSVLDHCEDDDYDVSLGADSVEGDASDLETETIDEGQYVVGLVDDTQDPIEDEEQFRRVKEWISSHHLGTVELKDVLSNFSDISVVLIEEVMDKLVKQDTLTKSGTNTYIINKLKIDKSGETPQLPMDVIALVLTGLPVKNLLSLKVVSKEWCSVISSKKFVNAHLKRSLERTVIVHDYDKNFVDRNSVALLDTSSPQQFSRLEFPYEATPSFFRPQAEVVGSSRGIVCVFVVNLENPSMFPEPYLYLWNPATKQSKPIPVPTIERRHVKEAFAFDSFTEDFKIVRVGYGGDNTVVEIYSANSNTWHVAEAAGNIPSLPAYRFCVDGMLCFAGQNCIFAFDLNRELYTGPIKYPSVGYGDCKTVTCLDQPPVTFLYCQEFDYKATVHIWILENIECLSGEVEPSWVPTYSIDISGMTDINSYFISADHCRNLLLVRDGRSWYWRDDTLAAGNYRLPLSRYLGQVFKYTQSLVSIPGFKQVTWDACELVEEVEDEIEDGVEDGVEDEGGPGYTFSPFAAGCLFVIFLSVICFMRVMS